MFGRILQKVPATRIIFLPQKEILCHWNKIFCLLKKLSWHRTNFTVTGSHFLSQEEISSHSKKIPVTEYFFLWKEILFLCQRISSSDRKFLPVTGNFFPWQQNLSCVRKVSSKDRIFLPVAQNFFLRKEHYSSGRNFLQYYSKNWVKITHLCRNLKYDKKSRTFVAILYQIYSRCFGLIIYRKILKMKTTSKMKMT